MLNDTLNIEVLEGNRVMPRGTIAEPSIHCSKVDITELWQSRKPTGYYYKGKWNFILCDGNFYQY